MKLIDLLSVINSYCNVIVVDWCDRIIATSNGKDSIPNNLNDSIVFEISAYSNTTLKVMINRG